VSPVDSYYSVPDHIFREYDIRGLAGRDIDEEFAYRLGLSFARMLPAGDAPVAVGRDARLSGEPLQSALMRGLMEAGVDLLDLGMIPSPIAYFAVFQMQLAGCVVVTASHNPAAFNGFKMMVGQASLFGDEIMQLQAAMQQPPRRATRCGRREALSVLTEYQRIVTADCRLSRPLRVVIDAGNGPAGVVAAPLYRALGCEVTELYCQPDGRFPNHHPDPTVAENLRDLAAAVRAQGADLGLAFDGDGDRLGVVDADGAVIASDLLLLLLARAVLKQHPGATIISEVKSSQRLYDGIRRAGGQAIMWRTGHSPMKAKMRQSGALLAGEMSGHIFFADRFYGVDDAVYAGARVMQMLADSGATLAEMLADLPATAITPEIRIACRDDVKFTLVEAAIRHFRQQGYEVIDIDGMRIRFDDGWGLLRASNTQPALVMRFEASSAASLQAARSVIESWLSAQGVQLFNDG